MNLGIDTNTNQIYEGNALSSGYPLWPSPLIYSAALFQTSVVDLAPKKVSQIEEAEYLFREDDYDPSSRIRRGRLYIRSTSQPMEWRVGSHPMMQGMENPLYGPQWKSIQLVTFLSVAVSAHLDERSIQDPLVVLGSHDSFTVWAILGIEAIGSREDLLTLRSRTTFGALPILIIGSVPESSKQYVQERIHLLSQDIHSAGPESIIDRAREAATGILYAYLKQTGHDPGPKDLHELVKMMGELDDGSKKRVCMHAAELVRLFHPRSKLSEQTRRNTRPIHERDAELAVQCVGAMMLELGWGRWRF